MIPQNSTSEKEHHTTSWCEKCKIRKLLDLQKNHRCVRTYTWYDIYTVDSAENNMPKNWRNTKKSKKQKKTGDKNRMRDENKGNDRKDTKKGTSTTQKKRTQLDKRNANDREKK